MKTNPPASEFNVAGFYPNPVILNWKRILVPVDFSESSVRALNHAIPLARITGAKLVLLHVVQFPILPSPLLSGALGNVKSAHKDLTNEAKARLDELARQVEALGVTIHSAVTVGTAWDEIVKGAERLECDLVVISTHGHNTLARILSSNTAEHVVRLASCPVFCVRG
jgi:nucleotide-binding universal stress UspA family protein